MKRNNSMYGARPEDTDIFEFASTSVFDIRKMDLLQELSDPNPHERISAVAHDAYNSCFVTGKALDFTRKTRL